MNEERQVAETADRPKEGAPSTLLTFLIADVRGYTRFTSERGDEAAARLADRFAALCEEVLEAHDGQVIELRGDEALAVFSSARQALRGAVALEERFHQATEEVPSLPLNVGVGLDAGEPVPVRGGYRGGALNLAARLCSIAGAGEILASETVTGLARRTEGLAFVDRGPVNLKGVATPVRVLQIAREGALPPDLPPLQPILVTHPTNLPDESTPFVGREEEVDRLVALLRAPHARLVTLTGPGGSGKTRLALQVGARLLYDFPDGVFLCDLAPLTDPALVPSAIAGVLGVHQTGGQDLVELLIERLRDREMLLVLDNFEHLLPAASLLARLLDGCRTLHLLVTSRTPLHLSWEQEHAVPPLALPDATEAHDLARLARVESVALFLQRARAAKDTFTLTAENAAAVAAICARLDGLPLALELAAARVRLFPPQALLGRLDQRFTLLTGGARDKPTRQQTLRGAIDWSYSLLRPEERTLFHRLAVFAGGWFFEAAEAVCAGEGDLDLLEGLASLVEKSLVRQEGEDEPRFSMLESIRAYAVDQLQKSGEAEEMGRRHAQFFLAVARSANLTNEAEGTQRHDLIIRDRDNVRAAIQWASDAGDIELGLRIATAIENYWVTNSPAEGKRRLSELLERAGDIPSDLRAITLRARGATSIIVGEVEEGTRYYEESLDLYRSLGDERGIGIMYVRLGSEMMHRGDMEGGHALIEESLRLYQKLGFKKGEAQSLSFLARVELGKGNEERAFELLRQSAALSEEVGFVWWRANVLIELSELMLQGGRLEEAEVYLHQTLPLATQMNDRPTMVWALALLAWLAGERAQGEWAGRFWGAIEAEEAREPIEQWATERNAFALRVLSRADADFERGRGEGRKLSLAQAVEDASQRMA